jgi:predicted phage terminase large subunit-like protein
LTFLAPTGKTPLEGLFGGAAGGGKSHALLMGAAQYVEVPGYAALLLRRTTPDLNRPGAILDMSRQWWGGSGARFNTDAKTWTFPSGATVTFGHMEHEGDKYNYQGAMYQYIAFDELSTFSESQYTYLISRLRRLAESDVPIRMRSTSNPGGVGHEWVKRRFPVTDDDLGPQFDHVSGRFFVPSRLTDNPSLDRDEYRLTLSEVDPVLRAQLLEGNWSVQATGATFRPASFVIVDSSQVPKLFERVVRFWDVAATAPTEDKRADWTVGAKVGRDDLGRLWVLDLRRFQGTPSEVEAMVRLTAERLDGDEVGIRMEQEPGASGKIMVEHYATRVLATYDFSATRSTGTKTARAVPLATQMDARNVVFVDADWVPALVDEFLAFPWGSHDDQVDAVAGAANDLLGGYELRLADPALQRLFSRL